MTTATPRVRLVVPTTGQRPDYLRQCLASIRRQHERIDLVMVAPAKAKVTLRPIAEQYGCRLMSEREEGISNAINQGWADADAPYLGWLGDDDLLTDDSVSLAVRVLQSRPDAAMAYGKVRVIDAHGKHIYTMRPGKYAPRVLRYGLNFVWQPGSLYRRDAVRRVGLLDPSLRYAMDVDLHLRLYSTGRVAYIPHLLACYRWHSACLTFTNPQPGAERRLVVRRYLGSVARSWEGCWWPLVSMLGRGWGAVQYRTGRSCSSITGSTVRRRDSDADRQPPHDCGER